MRDETKCLHAGYTPGNAEPRVMPSETHRQLSDEQLAAAGIDSGMVRLSVGLESAEDIISDLEQAFSGLQI